MGFDLSGCGAGLDESATSLLERGPVAEALGYDGLWINEEHFGQGSRVCLSPILLATPLAMRTSRIRIALYAKFGFGGFRLVTGLPGNLPQQHVVTTLKLFATKVRPRQLRTHSKGLVDDHG